MTAAQDGERLELLLALERDPDGRVCVRVHRTAPATDYGTVELADLAVLLEALLAADGERDG